MTILQRIIENPKSKEARVLNLGRDYIFGGKYIDIIPESYEDSMNDKRIIWKVDQDNPRTYGNGKYLLQWGFKYEGKEYWEDDVLTDGYIIEWGEEEAGFYLFENNAARTHYIQNMGDLEVIGNLAHPELKSKLEK